MPQKEIFKIHLNPDQKLLLVRIINLSFIDIMLPDYIMIYVLKKMEFS